MNEINIENTDRGDETIEELEERLPQAAIDMANRNAENVVKRKAKEAKRFNSRNRSAWDRMNRPSKLKKIEENMERILNFCNFKGYVLDSELPVETKGAEEAKGL